MVVDLGTGQCDISADLVVAWQYFDIDLLTYSMLIVVVGLVILMLLAEELGKGCAQGATEERSAMPDSAGFSGSGKVGSVPASWAGASQTDGPFLRPRS